MSEELVSLAWRAHRENLLTRKTSSNVKSDALLKKSFLLFSPLQSKKTGCFFFSLPTFGSSCAHPPGTSLQQWDTKQKRMRVMKKGILVCKLP